MDEPLSDGGAARPTEVDVLLVCTGGGHLLQLWSLREAWAEYARAWVVGSRPAADVDSLLAGERVHFAHAPANRSLTKLVRNLLMARRLLRELRPRAVITTGAAVAVPFAWLARLHGIPVVWVESLARAERPSLSCRLVAPFAERIYVQWPELLSALPGAHYKGTVFSSP
jgi:UDP-N-acetylglucosamine:LPS N-acetylglucosamine transferase